MKTMTTPSLNRPTQGCAPDVPGFIDSMESRTIAALKGGLPELAMVRGDRAAMRTIRPELRRGLEVIDTETWHPWILTAVMDVVLSGGPAEVRPVLRDPRCPADALVALCGHWNKKIKMEAAERLMARIETAKARVLLGD